MHRFSICQRNFQFQDVPVGGKLLLREFRIHRIILIDRNGYRFIHRIPQSVFLRQYKGASSKRQMIFCQRIFLIVHWNHIIAAPYHPVHQNLMAIRYRSYDFRGHIQL